VTAGHYKDIHETRTALATNGKKALSWQILYNTHLKNCISVPGKKALSF
jgi:predicted  nucleic acid-binding Zn ribbon protein